MNREIRTRAIFVWIEVVHKRVQSFSKPDQQSPKDVEQYLKPNHI
jgi:hypothetical protein